MDANKVIIKIIQHGEKKYITKIEQNSFSYQTSSNPFNDPEILKFEPDEALKIAEKLNSSHYGLSVVDINGKNLYHRYDNKINEIINEEFRKILKEGYVMEHENFKFREPVKNSTFYNYDNFSNDYDIDISESDIVVNWRIGFWLNDMGVESFLVKVDSVEGTYKVLLLDKQTDEVSQEIDKNIAEEPWKFDFADAVLKLNNALYISGLDFDFKTKICTVSFYDTVNQY